MMPQATGRTKELAEAEARQRGLEAALGPLAVVKAGLGKHAGTVGAAMWARHRLGNEGTGAR